MKKKKGLVEALSAAFLRQAIQRREFIEYGKTHGRSKYMPHQGAKECKRRRKQMLTGEFAAG